MLTCKENKHEMNPDILDKLNVNTDADVLEKLREFNLGADTDQSPLLTKVSVFMLSALVFIICMLVFADNSPREIKFYSLVLLITAVATGITISRIENKNYNIRAWDTLCNRVDKFCEIFEISSAGADINTILREVKASLEKIANLTTLERADRKKYEATYKLLDERISLAREFLPDYLMSEWEPNYFLIKSTNRKTTVFFKKR